jgi:hypothetical protein
MYVKQFVRVIVSRVFLVMVACLMPLPIRDRDAEKIIVKSLRAIQAQSRVLVDGKLQPFYDAHLISRSARKWYYRNETRLSDDVFLTLGLERLPDEYIDDVPDEWFRRGNVLVVVTDRDPTGRSTQPGLRFNCYHGAMGAQGYRVHIYRCLLGRFAWYTLEWGS